MDRIQFFVRNFQREIAKQANFLSESLNNLCAYDGFLFDMDDCVIRCVLRVEAEICMLVQS